MLDLGTTFLTLPPLRTTGRMVRLSTAVEPTVDDDGGRLEVGTELLREDTGRLDYWTGSVWSPVTLSQKILQIADKLLEQG